MKSFITNNWKKILICIGSISIIVNAVIKIATNKTLLSDYVKYGKDIEKSEILENATEVITNNSIAAEAPVGENAIKFIALLMFAILAIVFVTSLVDKSAAKAKKK